MVTVALFVRLEAKPGKEPEVEKFLKGGLPIVEGEPATSSMASSRARQTLFLTLATSSANSAEECVCHQIERP